MLLFRCRCCILLAVLLAVRLSEAVMDTSCSAWFPLLTRPVCIQVGQFRGSLNATPMWKTFQKFCEAKTYADAEKHCQQFNGTLVTVCSEEENDIISGTWGTKTTTYSCTIEAERFRRRAAVSSTPSDAVDTTCCPGAVGRGAGASDGGLGVPFLCTVAFLHFNWLDDIP